MVFRSLSSCSPRSLLLCLFLFLTVGVQAQSREKLSSKAKREIKKALTGYVRATDDTERAKARGAILSHGRLAVDHLLTFAPSKKLSDAAAAIRAGAPAELGWDLIKIKAPPIDDYGRTYFLLGEVVLVRTKTALAGFRVSSKLDPNDGIALIDWWTQDRIDRGLAQPGGASGQIRVKGTLATKKLRPNAGYNEHDFSVVLGPQKVSVRFVGPNCLVPRLDGVTEWALTGHTSPKSLKGTSKELRFLSAEPPGVRRLRVALPEYLFRVLPGCTPLPLEADEVAEFAQYQQVQVAIRSSRPAAEPIVLVQLPEYETSGFLPHHVLYIENFVRALCPSSKPTIVVAGGSGGGLEGGVFWRKTTWKRPDAALKRILRFNFPTM